ncbi:hypothetical protein BIW11_06415 [Tropilaelaps mercedesae]|uniref:Uncharacterized protein n=1 Tax=Tropilaelaps mercedesae TaxID=418985 RepID=A0A1V9XY28_9ACAR|nr:hypothetical protein BIW11_06415 [Tropilaelaps mercedesae]
MTASGQMQERYSVEFLNFLREAREQNRPRSRSTSVVSCAALRDSHRQLPETQTRMPISDWQRIFGNAEAANAENERHQHGGSANTVGQVTLSHRSRRSERSPSATAKANSSRPNNKTGSTVEPSAPRADSTTQANEETNHDSKVSRPDLSNAERVEARGDRSISEHQNLNEECMQHSCSNFNSIGSRVATVGQPSNTAFQGSDTDAQQTHHSDERTNDIAMIEQTTQNNHQTSPQETANQPTSTRPSVIDNPNDHVMQHHSARLHESVGYDTKALQQAVVRPVEQVTVACQTSGEGGLGQTDINLSSECRTTDERHFKDTHKSTCQFNLCTHQKNTTNGHNENNSHAIHSQDYDARASVASDSDQRMRSDTREPSASGSFCSDRTGESTATRRRANSVGRVPSVDICSGQQSHPSHEGYWPNFTEERAPRRCRSTHPCDQFEQRPVSRRHRAVSLNRSTSQQAQDFCGPDRPDQTSFEPYLAMAYANAPTGPTLSSWPMHPYLRDHCVACTVGPTQLMPMGNGISWCCCCAACVYECPFRHMTLPY